MNSAGSVPPLRNGSGIKGTISMIAAAIIIVRPNALRIRVRGAEGRGLCKFVFFPPYPYSWTLPKMMSEFGSDPHYWRDAGTVQPDGSRAVGEPLYDPRHAEARRRDILEHYVGGRNSGRGAEKTWRDRVRAVRDMVYETREDEARRRDGGEGYPGV